MGLFDDITSGLSDAFSSIFSGPQSNVGQILGGLDVGSSSPFPVNPQVSYPIYQPAPVYQNTMAGMPAVMGGIGRSLARFPNLSTALVALSQQFGKRFTPDQLWRMLKNNGPGLVGGLIGAAALNELAVWKTTHKSRRMNVANTRALRRSVRRLRGFDRLAHRVSSQLARVGGTRRRSASRRCGTCRSSPCRC